MRPATPTTTIVLITGMRDNGCRERVAVILGGLLGVKEALVSLHRGRATVLHDAICDPVSLIHAITHAGYRATLARRR